MNALAFIHARGGSKRIPRKNIRSFADKPALSYPINAALEAQCFDDIFISTDDEETKDLALKTGASFDSFRDPLLANDRATTSDVLKADIEKALKTQKFTYACCLYGTAVFTNKNMLLKAFELLKSSGAKVVHPVQEFSFPVQRALKINAETHEAAPLFPELISARSQDLTQAYHDVGQFYWVRVEEFLKEPDLNKGSKRVFALDKYSVQDIDDEKDWLQAEKLFKS